MADKRKNPGIKPKQKKRFINACPGYIDENGRLSMTMTYVLDTGNLISDVQHLLKTKTIHINADNSEYEEKIYERCMRGRQKLKHDLESAIRATGANRLNAEITAKHLLEKMI